MRWTRGWTLFFILGEVLFCPGLLVLPAEAGIAGSKHDLSYANTAAEVRAVSAQDNQICVFCHTPHNSHPATPLWNHNSSGAAWLLYDQAHSPTLQAAAGQPEGSAKLCLSCHDGTVALGAVASGGSSQVMPTTVQTLFGRKSGLGTDLRDDHPVSVPQGTQDPEILPQPALSEVKLDNGKVQCTTCHDPHTPDRDPLLPKFLTAVNDDGGNPAHGSRLCRACHQKNGWISSAHYGAADTYTSGAGHPYDGKSVSMWACQACHAPHNATRPVWLLNDAGSGAASASEGACLRCHGAGGPGDNVRPAVDQGYGHRLELYSAEHRPAGDGNLGTEPPSVTVRHVECTDCHSPHRAGVQNGRTLGTNVVSTSSGQALLGMTVNRIIASSYPIPPVNVFAPPNNPLGVGLVAYEYEVCFRCHATASSVFTGTDRGRIDEFVNPNNTAFHPVVARGALQPVVATALDALKKTLVPPITPDSTIYCSDCHDPHATNPWLLKYTTADLCYQCHQKYTYYSYGSYSRWSGHATGDHRDFRNFPPGIPPISCFACHGDFSPGGGGMHGTNLGEVSTPARWIGRRFMNGFAIELVRTSAPGAAPAYNCYSRFVNGVGCANHVDTPRGYLPKWVDQNNL